MSGLQWRSISYRDEMRIIFKCISVVTQGVQKILIRTIDDLSNPEEQMILNLSQERGGMDHGADYEMVITKITAISP
jgi:hypothetical protein